MARVLVLHNLYPPHHLGGYELWCRDVVERMAARGHRVTVLTSTERRPGVAEVPGERGGAGGVAVRRDLPWWWDDHVLTSPPVLERLRQERRAHRILEEVLDEVQPDVVSVWNMGAMSLGLLTAIARRGIPMVFVVCDDWLVYGPNLDAWTRALGRGALRRLAGRALDVAGLPTRLPEGGWPGTYLFVSERTRAAAREARGWAFTDSEVVPSGIDLGTFPVGSGPVEERPWRWQLLFAGRVEARKGPATAVRALTHLPAAATLDVLGPIEPAYEPEIRELVASLDLDERVHFDTVPRAELPPRYRDADVVVFPSEWEEPFGLVPLEAMACDTPVVATGVGGSADFLTDGENCLLFAPGDDVDLARAIRALADDGDLRRRVVLAGRATATWADADRLADTMCDRHERALPD